MKFFLGQRDDLRKRKRDPEEEEIQASAIGGGMLKKLKRLFVRGKQRETQGDMCVDAPAGKEGRIIKPIPERVKEKVLEEDVCKS